MKTTGRGACKSTIIMTHDAMLRSIPQTTAMCIQSLGSDLVWISRLQVGNGGFGMNWVEVAYKPAVSSEPKKKRYSGLKLSVFVCSVGITRVILRKK